MDSFNWQHISAGDRKAYSMAYSFYFRRLYNYGLKFSKNETVIEDTIQEVFLMLWTHRKRFTTIQSPQSYIYHSFRNALLYKLKQLNKRQEKEAAITLEPEFNVESILIRSEQDAALKSRLEQAIKELPSRQREALFLRFYEGMPYEKVADVMQISVPSAYKTVSKAVLQLRGRMNIPLVVLLSLLYSMTS